MQQEEACEAELVDQLQLFVEPRFGLASQRVGARIAVLERAHADVCELHDRRLRTVGEVRIAIAELLREVEAEPLGELDGARHCGAILRETLDDLTRREQDAFVVAAPLGLAAVQRAAVTDGDEDILQRRAARVMCMHVTGHERRHAERLGELAQGGVAASVPTLVRPLQLDEEALASEGPGEPLGGVRIADGKAVARAAGETDEPFVELLEQALVEGGVRRRLRLLPRRAGMGMRGGEQPAEVRVAPLRLDQQRHVRVVGERHFGTRDRTHAEVLGRVRELERAVDAVVVGQRERRIAELGRPHGELLRQRRSVEERVGRVRVQFDVRHLSFALPQLARGRRTLRAAAGEREPLLLACAVRELGLELDRHTRPGWTASC